MKRRFVLALSAALVAFASSAFVTARAQTPTTDPVLKRMWSLGMDSSHTWDLSQTFFDSIGPRLTGTPQGNQASDWVMRTYRSWAIDTKREQYGTWRGWRRGYSHIDLISPRVRSLEATTLGFSPGTAGKDVVGGTIILPMVQDSNEFVKWLPAVKGKFVLISAAYPSCRPEDEWAVQATPESKARMDTTIVKLVTDWTTRIRNTGYPVSAGNPTGALGTRIEKAGAAGVIVSNMANPLSGAWGTYTVYDTKNKTALGIAMSCEDYGLLYRLTERKQGPQLRVNAQSESLGEVPVFDTFGSIKGVEKANEYVMLSAHFDSWDGSQGATDNGTGTIIMMEAMRILKQAYPRPKRTIIVGHWPGEEQGLNGSRAYAYDHPEIVRGMQALFNQDNGTGRIVSTSGVGLPDAGAHMQAWLTKLPQEFQTQIRYSGVGGPATGGTDNASFDCYGAPAFGLSAQNWDYGSYTHHTNRDSFDKIVFDDLKGNATIVAMLAYLASEDPTFITRERADLTANPGGGRGGRGGPPSGRAALSAQLATGGRGAGGGGGANNVDAKGWALTCPKTPRFTNDTSRVTTQSVRP
ncbi:MAG TPA: M20/M25/M40 family metallo-hydrolase [Gemmatimonadaceae bacterium]|nr:M20/M25/M40 family metallo-hydrolase [Gemmatimonadaceae bacterium]